MSRLLRRDRGLLIPSFPNVTIIALRIQQTIGIAIEQGNAHFRRCRVLKIGVPTFKHATLKHETLKHGHLNTGQINTRALKHRSDKHHTDIIL